MTVTSTASPIRRGSKREEFDYWKKNTDFGSRKEYCALGKLFRVKIVYWTKGRK